MDKKYNIFISHHGKDDKHVLRLKERLKESGYSIRNSSVDSESNKYRPKRPSDAVIERYLRRGINWAGTFICLIGEKTHTRPWVDYEIKQAHLQGKRIVGVYLHGCKDDVKLPKNFKLYGGTPLGWNSLDKLQDAIEGKPIPAEKPSGSPQAPIFTVTRVRCSA